MSAISRRDPTANKLTDQTKIKQVIAERQKKKKCAPSFNFMKVTLVALAMIGLISLIFIPIYSGNQSSNSHAIKKPLHIFPSHLPRFMNNGLQVVRNGWAACGISTPVESREKCEQLAYIGFQSAKQEGLTEQLITPQGWAEKGMAVEFYDGASKVHVAIGMNPQKFENYKNALRYTEKKILQNPKFFQNSTSQILDTFKQIHHELMRDLSIDKEQMMPGKFRKKWMFVGEGKFTLSIENLLAEAQRIYTHEELRIFEDSLPKVMKTNTPEHLNQAERAVWQKMVHLPPSPDLVAAEMRAFVDELKMRIPQQMDPLEIACWAHEEIVRIHPFTDGNGRFARILFFTLYEPLIFPDDEAYTAALIENNHSPGAFLRYVRDSVIPWNEAQRERLD